MCACMSLCIHVMCVCQWVDVDVFLCAHVRACVRIGEGKENSLMGG
jgi:hypothetical protein